MADPAAIIAECSAIFQTDLANTYGALFIGLVLSVLLLGITNLQVYMYYQRYEEDRLWHKLTVVLIWILDIFHTALITHCVYWWLVTSYFKPWELLEVPWSFKLQLVVNTFSVFSVHILYYIRLWKLVFIYSIKKSLLTKVWCAIVTFFMITAAGTVGGLVWAIYTQIHTTNDFHKISYMSYTILANATVLDFIFTISFCAQLARYRKTNFIGMKSAIPTIIAYTISTNLLTSLCSLSAIILCAAMPDNYIYVMVEFLITKLYVNSYMAMLNARRFIQTNKGFKPNLSGTTAASAPTTSFNRQGPAVAPLRFNPDEMEGHDMESIKATRGFEYGFQDLRRVDSEAGMNVDMKDGEETRNRRDKEGPIVLTMQRAYGGSV